jgi:hypothetical protein
VTKEKQKQKFEFNRRMMIAASVASVASVASLTKASAIEQKSSIHAGIGSCWKDHPILGWLVIKTAEFHGKTRRFSEFYLDGQMYDMGISDAPGGERSNISAKEAAEYVADRDRRTNGYDLYGKIVGIEVLAVRY